MVTGISGNRILHIYICGTLYGSEHLADVLIVIIGVWGLI